MTLTLTYRPHLVSAKPTKVVRIIKNYIIFITFLTGTDEIVRIRDDESIELNDLPAVSNESSHTKIVKRAKNLAIPKSREVLLAKISIYIVYMLVCCHR